MPQATLEKGGKRIKVESNSPEAQKYFSQGYTLAKSAPVDQPLPSDMLSMDYLKAVQSKLGSGEAANRYSQASKDYQSGLANQGSFASALKLALQGADTETGALQKQRRAMIEQQANLPTQMREQLMAQGVQDPFARQNLINQKYNAMNTGAGNLNDEITKKGGQLQDVLNTGTAGYQSNLQAQQAGLQDLANQAQTEQGVLTDWYKQQLSDAEANKELSRNKDLYAFQQGNKVFSPNGDSPTPKKLTATEIKNNLVSDINTYNDLGLVARKGEELTGNGTLSREQIAQDVYEEYKNDGYTLEQVKKIVYDAYPG